MPPETGTPGTAWTWGTVRLVGGPSPWQVWPLRADSIRTAWQEAGSDALTLGLGEAWRSGPGGFAELLALLETHPDLVAFGSPGWPGDARPAGAWVVPEWVWQGDAQGQSGTWQWQGKVLSDESRPDWTVRALASADVLLQTGPRETAADGPRWVRPHALQGKDRFLAGARRVLTQLAGDGLAKVVLSRDITLRAEAPVDPWSVFRGMARRAADSHRMAWQEPGEAAWLAASPERLCSWSGASFVTEALAGTAVRTPGSEALGDLDRPAAQAEQGVVQAGVRRALAGLAVDLREETPSPVAWQGLVHLKATLAGRLAPGATVADLVSALNPTAAVGGWPGQEAQAWIRWLEGRPRGRYAAPFGRLTAREGTLAVGIRGVAIREQEACVTVGAGLVRGSTPEGEWAETEAKLDAVLRLLGRDA